MSLTSENQISQVRSRLPVPLVTRLQVEIGLKLKTKNKPITKQVSSGIVKGWTSLIN